jgi:hypothetical protein
MVVEVTGKVKDVLNDNTRNDLFDARSKLGSGIAKYFYDFCRTENKLTVSSHTWNARRNIHAHRS